MVSEKRCIEEQIWVLLSKKTVNLEDKYFSSHFPVIL